MRAVGKREIGGFALLEALVCVDLISFAFLASAGLHLSSLRDTQSSGQISQATQLANELHERMRINIGNTDTYATASAAVRSACNTTTGCSAADMVANDLAEWSASLAAKLPNGRGVVCRDSTPDDGTSPGSAACTGGASDPIVIKVWWKLRDQAGSSGAVAAIQRQVLAFVPRP